MFQNQTLKFAAMISSHSNLFSTLFLSISLKNLNMLPLWLMFSLPFILRLIFIIHSLIIVKKNWINKNIIELKIQLFYHSRYMFFA